MEGFKIRLVEEKEGLQEKIDSLHKFLHTQAFMDLDKSNKVLLREQYKVMEDYNKILASRLKLVLTDDDLAEISKEEKR